MVKVSQLGDLPAGQLQAYRLVNSKFPPIALFDDVADADEFEALYQIQALTNPRLGNEVGRIELIPRREIPFGIVGCSYAIAPFTHVNPAGSRFSDGRYGMFYAARERATAVAETAYHHARFLAATQERAMHLPMRLYHVAIDARLHDLRNAALPIASRCT